MQQHVFQVTYKVDGGMTMTRSVNAENMWQAREKSSRVMPEATLKLSRA